MMFYLFACSLTNQEPEPSAVERFIWHSGKLANGLDYIVLEYPRPEPASMSAREMEVLRTLEVTPPLRLSPYYSAVIGSLDDDTILHERQVYVLGPGPDPTLPSLLDSLSNLENRKVQGGVILDEAMKSPADRQLGEDLSTWNKTQLEDYMRRSRRISTSQVCVVSRLARSDGKPAPSPSM